MALTQIAVLTHYFKYIDAGCTHGSWDPYLILGKLRYKKVHRHRKAGVFGQILHLLQSIKIQLKRSSPTKTSLNHRIINVEKDFQDHQVQPSIWLSEDTSNFPYSIKNHYILKAHSKEDKSDSKLSYGKENNFHRVVKNCWFGVFLCVISRKCPTFECCGVAEVFGLVSKSPDRASIAADSSVGFCNDVNYEVKIC